MNKITPADVSRRQQYLAAEPRQFGNLHERMRFLTELAGKTELPPSVRHAIFDLETEVSHHRPANPPFGRRASRTEGRPAS